MPETIKYSLSFQVVGGTSVPVAGQLTADAVEKIQVAVPAGATDLTVNLQPGGADLGQFLLIKASAYSEDLTYKVNDAAATAIVLDAPHVFIGAGAVAILDDEPTTLLFSNATAADVTIDILLGRDATP
jgi:hypothetical protein